MLLFQESMKLTQELLAAVDEGELAAVVKLLKNPELSVNVTNKVRREEEEGRERVRERERERDARCLFFIPFQHGESPLHIAAGYGRLKIVQLLRSHGATTNIKDKVRAKQKQLLKATR